MDECNRDIFEQYTATRLITFSKVLDFDNASEAFAIYKGILYVATYSRFYTVQNLVKREVVKDTFWESLYPNSIDVKDKSTVFIGIRGGIVKLDIDKQKLQFYKHKGASFFCLVAAL
jgi:hypothetical protein